MFHPVPKQSMRTKIRKKRRKTTGRIRLHAVVLTVIIILMISAAAVIAVNMRSVGAEGNRKEVQSGGQAGQSRNLVIEQPAPEIDMSGLNSYAGIIVRVSDGKVLGQLRAEEKIFPASLTKIMTCIVAIEHMEDPDEPVLVDPESYDELYAMGASMAGFLPGEEARVIDLLYGIILPSGGECSVSIGKHFAGTEDKFVEWMNQKAEELGMENTHFTNTVGLHDEEHYTTVEDVSILLRYALQNRQFRTIFSSKSYQVPPTNYHPEGFTFLSSVFSQREDWTLENGEIKGGKTGFTDEAGLCLATFAFIGNAEYIAVTAKAAGDHSTEPYHVNDAFYLYNQI